MLSIRCLVFVAVGVPALLVGQVKAPFQYFRVGSQADLVAKTTAGYALMGGGTDLDEAFRWLCSRAGGGDFLVLRAAGTDAYNPYIAGLENGADCKLNSVATLIIPSREAAGDGSVADAIRHAEAIFIAGGDQANYIRYWMGTPVQRELNAAIARGVPIGGTSAGLAVMGEWAYSAEGDKPDDANLDSKTALMDPMGARVTLVHGFLKIPVLKHVITDTHFSKRDRMGRLVAFLARLQASEHQGIRGIGVDEGAAVLVEFDGKAKVIGKGSAYFIWPYAPIRTVEAGKPLKHADFNLQRVPAGKSFDITKWCCGWHKGPESIEVIDGQLRLYEEASVVE
jgi:cyanophycinase